MKNSERRRREAYEANVFWFGETYDPRRLRREARVDAVYVAYLEGQNALYHKRKPRNPYPPGKRHDEWKRGLNLADPMGDHMGRNE
jgi:hypothetical protein